MCSIFKYRDCVGRNFDYEVSYDEELRVIEPMAYGNELRVMGMCTGFVKNYPLMYDGINEKGLVVGALAFTGNAHYFDEVDDKVNIPAIDFVFQILSSFKSVREVCEFVENVNISNKQFSDEFPNSDLHWFVADKDKSIVIESVDDGLYWYASPLGIMTNNPPYFAQMKVSDIELSDIRKFPYSNRLYDSRGTETYGLTGDYTSIGRFARLKYLKRRLEESDDSFNSVCQTFHLCSSVEQIYGVTNVEDKFEYTIYSVVYDMSNVKVYLRMYDEVFGYG